MTEYFYNTDSHQVEEGHQSSWTHLMGPYPTREAAEHALESAHARSEQWDGADQAWQGGDAAEPDA